MSDMSDAPRIWAHKGEAVTCINGHAICEIARNIYVGEGRQSSDFTNWSQKEPDTTEHVAEIRCDQCRGVWIRGNQQAGYQFHFGSDAKEGWR